MTHRFPGLHAYCFMTGGSLLCVIVDLVIAGLRPLTRLRIAFAGLHVFTRDFGLLRAGHRWVVSLMFSAGAMLYAGTSPP